MATQPTQVDIVQTTVNERIIAILKENGLPYSDLDDSTMLFGAFDEKTLAGIAGIEFYGSFVLLRSICATPGYRNRGVGTALVKHLLSLAASKGAKEDYLLTTSTSGFFKKFGFFEIKRVDVDQDVRACRQFSSTCPATAIVMTKKFFS